MPELHSMAEALVKTQSCYVAVLDEASPVNTLNFMMTSLEAGKVEARRRGLEEVYGLFAFNDQLMRAARAGELLAWTLLFDGVFRAVSQLVPSSSRTAIDATTDLGSADLTGKLVCPSGRLLICCLADLGKPQRPFMQLEPGSYRVSLSRDDDGEFQYSLLESPHEYPVGDGPDWSIQVERLSMSRDGSWLLIAPATC